MERFPSSIVLGDQPYYKGHPVATVVGGRQIAGKTRDQLLSDYPRLDTCYGLQVGHLYLHLCPNCQQWFIAHHAKRYCSHACMLPYMRSFKIEAQRKRRARAREWRDDLPQSCEQCGEAINAQRVTRRFCSDRCRKRHSRSNQPTLAT